MEETSISNRVREEEVRESSEERVRIPEESHPQLSS